MSNSLLYSGLDKQRWSASLSLVIDIS